MSGFKNAAVSNPSARDIGDSKMRCLVKCMAMFGLGHYIYAGEDLPPDSNADPDPAKSKAMKEAIDQAKNVKTETLDEAVEQAMEGAMSEKDAQEYINLTIGFANETRTVAGLKSLHTENKKVLDGIKASHPEIYEDYVAKFKARRSEVQTTEEGK
jgi:hypothetical protein